MTEQELQLAIKKGEVENVTPEQVKEPDGSDNPIQSFKLDDFIPFLSILMRPKSNVTAVPQGAPQSFADQIRFYNNKLYYYVNNAWRTAGAQIAAGLRTRSSGSGTGSESITGVGFTPVMLVVFAMAIGSNNGWSIGAGKPGSQRVIYRKWNGSAWINSDGGLNDYVIQATDASDNARSAQITSFDSDGWTFNWVGSSINTTYLWLAIG